MAENIDRRVRRRATPERLSQMPRDGRNGLPPGSGSRAVGDAVRRVIEQTIGKTLPDDYQSADFLLERGMVDQAVTRREVPTVLGSVLRTRMMGRDRLPAA